jgi:hypothetical protein
MLRRLIVTLFAATLPALAQQDAKPSIAGQVNGAYPEPAALDFNDHTGYTSLFDGKSLAGWDGRPGVWSVQDGVIVGESSKEKNAGNTFLVCKPIQAHDFDLKLEVKVELGGGSGIQYRSSTGIPPGRVAGKGEPPLDPRWVMMGRRRTSGSRSASGRSSTAASFIRKTPRGASRCGAAR